jgi:hypothetical protein
MHERKVAQPRASINATPTRKPRAEEERDDIVTAAKTMGQQLIVLEIASSAELETAFTTFPQRGVGALLIGSGAFLNSHRERIVMLAAHHRLPGHSVRCANMSPPAA